MRKTQIPPKYFCSITGQIMVDPVVAADGYTYERKAIEKWLEAHDVSPTTNEILKNKILRPNYFLVQSLTSLLITGVLNLSRTPDPKTFYPA
jgi:hypothetical protein